MPSAAPVWAPRGGLNYRSIKKTGRFSPGHRKAIRDQRNGSATSGSGFSPKTVHTSPEIFSCENVLDCQGRISRSRFPAKPGNPRNIFPDSVQKKQKSPTHSGHAIENT